MPHYHKREAFVLEKKVPSPDDPQTERIEAVLQLLDAYYHAQIHRLQKIRFDLQTAMQTNRPDWLKSLWRESRMESLDDTEIYNCFILKTVGTLENSTPFNL